MTQVLAPCPGRVIPVADVPDPVFAAEMVGPGVAIEPSGEIVTVVAPISGRVLKLHPHAFVVLDDEGLGVLVHLGINTVRLEGRGFDLLAAEGDTVAAGDPMVRWDPSAVDGADMSTVVPVVLMDRPKGSVPAPAPDLVVATCDPLFTA